jgi:dinuclear metal center YbgI/SA1388 family protein
MARLLEITRFLDKELKIKKIKDSSQNGLQIRCKNDVFRVGFAVDSCLSTFELAKKEKVDLLIVHHGVKWKPQKYKPAAKLREDFLRKNKISLYASHLPLDANAKYGNNIELCRILKLINLKPYAPYHGRNIGFRGEFKHNASLNQISEILNKVLNTKCKIYDFGKNSVKSIGVVSGGGSESIEETLKLKLDCFLLGEIDMGAYHRAKDYKLSMILAGHYATETLGVKALMPLISKIFKVKTVFIDNPTGI